MLLKDKRYKGLTSTELMGVCIVILLLCAASFLTTHNVWDTEKITEATLNINTLGDAHTAYYHTNSTFASNATLVSEGYIIPGKMWDGAQMVDAWETPLVMTVSGSKLTIQLSPTSQVKAGKNISVTVE